LATITRVSPPKAVGEISTESYLWEVNLSGIVAPGWIDRFRTAGGGTAVAQPAKVTFEPVSALSFVSPKEDVEEWMGAIDTWIAATNATMTQETDAADTRARDTETAKGDALHDRLRVASDAVKDL
jgi:hypothetical protein